MDYRVIPRKNYWDRKIQFGSVSLSDNDIRDMMAISRKRKERVKQMSDMEFLIYHMKKNNVCFDRLRSWEKRILEVVGKHNCVVRAGGKWWRAGGNDVFYDFGAYRICEDYTGEDAEIIPMVIFMRDEDTEKLNEQYSFDPDGLESGLENWNTIKIDEAYARNVFRHGAHEEIMDLMEGKLEKQVNEKLIEAAKVNRIQWSLLSADEQEVYRKAGRENCIVCLAADSSIWDDADINTSFRGREVYRIKAEYKYAEPQPEKKLVSYPMYAKNGEYVYKNKRGEEGYIDIAHRYVGFEEIEYEGDHDSVIRKHERKPLRVWFWE